MSRHGDQVRALLADDLSRRTGLSLPGSALIIFARLEKGPLRMSDLGQQVGVSTSTVSRQVQQLERRGLIDRTTDDDDKRAAIVGLSEKGKRAAEELLAVRESFLLRVFEQWEEGEVAQAALMLERLTAVIGREAGVENEDLVSSVT